MALNKPLITSCSGGNRVPAKSRFHQVAATVRLPALLAVDGRIFACERQLLAAMPVIPMFHDTWRYLTKPFVKGLACNTFDGRSFKYAWIDTKWKPS